jgi:hypothetical protein
MTAINVNQSGKESFGALHAATRCWNEDIKSRIIFHTRHIHCINGVVSKLGSPTNSVQKEYGEKKEKTCFLRRADRFDGAFADDGALKNHLGPSMSIIGQLIPPQHILHKSVRGCFLFLL